jgi:hypothetical protein
VVALAGFIHALVSPLPYHMKTLLCWLFVSVVTLASAADIKPQKNIAAGRVTFADGKPITGDIDDYQIAIQGVSEAGEKVSYSPVVKNGAYKQKVVPGQYSFGLARIKVTLDGTVFTLPLEPVGKLWNKNQDAEDGIVQDFVWKPTGQAPTYGEKANPNNHTHWYGMNLGMTFQGYRSDLSQVSVKLPAGTKLVFTLTPVSKSIDGRDLQPIVIEREWQPAATYPNDHLNDFPPASYEITGVAKLLDGSTRPIFFQGRGDYPKYVTTGKVPLEPGNYGGYWTQLMGWVTD